MPASIGSYRAKTDHVHRRGQFKCNMSHSMFHSVRILLHMLNMYIYLFDSYEGIFMLHMLKCTCKDAVLVNHFLSGFQKVGLKCDSK